MIFHLPWSSKSISKISLGSFIMEAAESNASNIPNISYSKTRFTLDSMSMHSKVHQSPSVCLAVKTLYKRPLGRRIRVPLTFLFKWVTSFNSFNPLLSIVWRFFYVTFHFQCCLSVVYAYLFYHYFLIASSAKRPSSGGTF
jgi:hypothetical protein